VLEDRCLLSAGALDPTFGNGAGYVTTSPTNGADVVHAALIQPDGKILAAGTVMIVTVKKNYSVLDAQDFGVVRYNANGSLDTSFGSGGQALASFGSVNLNPSVKNPSVWANAYAAALYPQAGTVNDGKIVLSGAETVSTGSSTQGFVVLARFNTNGTLDTTFGNQGEVTTSPGSSGAEGAVAVQPDGKIVAAWGSSTGFELARYNPNGSLDTTFGSGGEVATSFGQRSYANALLLQPDGKLIAFGDNSSSWEVVRYNPNGSLDTSFGTGGIVSGPSGTSSSSNGASAALYPAGTANAGKIVVDGWTATGWGMARYNPDGSLDGTFGSGGQVLPTVGSPGAIAIAADGKLVVASASNSIQAVLRFNGDGSADSTFGTGGVVTTAIGTGSSWAGAVALLSNGAIVTAGTATIGTKQDFTAARYLPSEPEIGSFTANPDLATAGSSVTLTASNITDGNPQSTVTQVAFYLDSNGDSQLEPGTDTLLGYPTQTSPGVWAFTCTVNLAPGSYTLFAQAKDSYGVFGDPLALTLTVQ
jgi:uncharacterized delta-60 repeat protein